MESARIRALLLLGPAMPPDCSVRTAKRKRPCLYESSCATINAQMRWFWPGHKITGDATRTEFRRTILHLGLEIKTFSQLSVKNILFFRHA